MKSIIFIFFTVFVVGCSSHENIVSVRQVQNDSPVILRIRKDRTAIHSLLYPIAFEFKKMVKKRFIMAKTLILPKMKIYVLEQRDAIYGWVIKIDI